MRARSHVLGAVVAVGAALALAADVAAAAPVVHMVAGVDSFKRTAALTRVLPRTWATTQDLGPVDVAAMPDGRLAVLDVLGAVVLIDQAGIERVHPGPDDEEYTNLAAVAASADGSVLVASETAVWRFANGRFRHVAGVDEFDEKGTTADGARATRTSMLPADIAASSDGGFVIADRQTRTVRRVDAAGVVTTVAGNRRRGVPAEGAQATRAPLPGVVGVNVRRDGALLLAGEDGVVREVGTDARIRSLLGGRRFPGLTEALDLPDGALALIDATGIQRVAPDGAAVRQVKAFDPGDAPQGRVYQHGRPLADAVLNAPIRLAADPAGGLAVATSDGVNLIAGEGETRRQAIAIDPETLATARNGRVTLHSTLGGTATLRMLFGTRRVAATTVTVPPGRSVVALPGPVASRVHTLTATIEASEGRVAADAVRVLPGKTLALRDARTILVDRVADELGDLGIGFRSGGCVRRSALNVRCRVIAYDTEAPRGRSDPLDITTARLRVGADGLPRVAGTPSTRRRPAIVLFG